MNGKNKKKERYVLGLDIGISSVGWGLLRLDENGNPDRIIDTGVKIFSPGEVPKTGASKNLERRSKRDSRRVTRRSAFRVDRTRHLLNTNGFLGENIESGLVSEVNEKLTKIYEKMINAYYKENNKNPYELKVEALDRKLTKEEFSIILVHYAKHRGYKSNREEENSKDKETGKVLTSISKNEKQMKENGYRTISEMFIKDERFQDKIRNAQDEYKTCVSREMYLEEINKVLESQIKFGLITEDFKKEYLEIWQSQRHYAKGPGGNSKYGGNLIEKMTGKCKFDGEPRAPKCAASTEIFVALTNLINFRYKTPEDSNYKKLEPAEIKKIIEVAKQQDKITYGKVFKELHIEDGIVKGLNATQKERQNALKKLKKEEKVEKLGEYREWPYERKRRYDTLKREEINKRDFIKLTNYSGLRKEFTKQLGTEKWNEIKDNYEFLDTIAMILTNYKLDEDVKDYIKANNIDEIYAKTILSLPNYKGHNKLSSKLIRTLNELMMEGLNYDEAMKKLGYNHSVVNSTKEKEDLLIPINQGDEIMNQRVIRSLSQVRGIINSVIKKYGMPERINIESARELAKSYDERKKIVKERDENHEKREKTKNTLVELGLFSSKDQISNTDVLKYNLWLEQGAKCTYSLENIPIEYLFDDNLVQIDHILPYSRTFDDTYFNKTLVLSKYNQEKENKTPYEWFGKTEKWQNYKAYITSLDIPEKKKDNYLLTELTLEIESDYRNQNLNDTKYISKYLVSYIKANLNVKKVGSPSGAITGKLRSYWHLNGLTHSLQSESYYLNEKEDAKKNRENHLHHAMDALVIASTNDTLIRRVSNYERYRRYFDNKPISVLLEYANKNTPDFDSNQYVNEDGTIDETSLKEFVKEIREKNYFINKKNNRIKIIAPEPYDGFSKEAKIRVYEQNKELMDFKLKEFNYTKEELENALPIIPKFAKEKIGGRLHGETYYSLRKNITNTKEEISKVSRINIASEKFKKEKLDKIIDKDAGSKEVYETVKNWLGNNQNGLEAFKTNQGYPINPKSGNIIKKIKIEEEYDGKGHIIKGKLVSKEDIRQIDVYKKENDSKLYFAAYDTLDLLQMKKAKDIDIDIWWNRGKHKNIKYSELNKEYQLYISLKKNDLVKIELNTGNHGIGYINGCSSGMLEIKSTLGDGFDLIGTKKLFIKERKQFQLTISIIKDINILKISNLGKIEQWDIDKFL